ncbi:MAG: SH3 domain-containing protein [Cyanobacteria bacterium P01_G01_bin.67]
MTKSIFIKRLSATAQFILGFILGISLIAGVTGAALFAYYKKMSILPNKPVFPEPTVLPESTPGTTESLAEIEPLESNTTQVEVEEFPVSLEEAEEPEEPEESEQPAPEPELPANAYRAVVTWPQGLSLRAEPSINAGRVGGIGANASIIILEESADGKWQRVRLPWSNQEGWVKGGNTKRTSY